MAARKIFGGANLVGNKLLNVAPGTESTDGVNVKQYTEYVQSRGQQLVTNGTGLLQSNYNFSALDFDTIEPFASGSFYYEGTYFNYRFENDEYLPLDISRKYRASLFIKSGDAGGQNYTPNSRHYAGFRFFDIDLLKITFTNYSHYAGSAFTTLAQPLNGGDMQVHLVDASGWSNSSNLHTRCFAYGTYTNSKGYTYPDYSYNRNTTGSGMWEPDGINGNIITLTEPWEGPTLPAGTLMKNNIRNNNDSINNTYPFSSVPGGVGNEWLYQETILDGIADNPSVFSSNVFPTGTAFIKLIFWFNHSANFTGTNTVRIANVQLTELEREIDATTFAGQSPEHYLNYNNLTNVPAIPEELFQINNNVVHLSDTNNNVGIGTQSTVSSKLAINGNLGVFSENQSGRLRFHESLSPVAQIYYHNALSKLIIASNPGSNADGGILLQTKEGSLTSTSIELTPAGRVTIPKYLGNSDGNSTGGILWFDEVFGEIKKSSRYEVLDKISQTLDIVPYNTPLQSTTYAESFFRIPSEWNGFKISAVNVFVHTSGTADIPLQLKKINSGTTNIGLGSIVAGNVSRNSPQGFTIATDDMILLEVGAFTGVPPMGLKMTLFLEK